MLPEQAKIPRGLLAKKTKTKKRSNIITNSGSLAVQMVKNLPAIQETWVQVLGGEDPLEEETVTHSSILAWRIPWTEEPGGLYSPWGHRVRHD